ncbi:MAG: acetyltransferase [Candidatus Bathyarchaeota archaeon]|nr:acetyltransferase [Candidatus Bathyarchaeota archaeon]MDH5495356.1 acetyltransferase [Candidatus Bathyarchaeota archaeon]
MSGKEVKKCPKCDEKLVEGTAEIFGNTFGCTRAPENLEALQGEKIQTYYCKKCGYLEFYKEKKK